MNAKLDALGVILDSDPRRVTKTGVMEADTTLSGSAAAAGGTCPTS